MNEESGGIWFFPADLKGVPEDTISMLEKGTEDNEGMLRVTFEYPQNVPVLSYAETSETRKRCNIGHENKCNQNSTIFKEIMMLRDEAARLLGYPNHAIFHMQEMVAESPEVAGAFLGDLRSRLKVGGQIELDALKQVKKEHLESIGESFHGRFFLWDLSFYKSIMSEKNYAIDHKYIAEFFPLQSTIKSMFEIFQHLFGLLFVEITSEEKAELADSGNDNDLVWHEDVHMFSVWDGEDEGGAFLGYLYPDLFPRKGKWPGMGNFNLQPGFTRSDGSRQYPATAMAPSQMLENWCWTPSALKSLSRHCSALSPEYIEVWKEGSNGTSQPPEQIPDDIIESLVKTKLFNQALFQLRVLQFSMFDMLIYERESHESIEKMNMAVEYNKLRKELMQIDGPEVLGQGHDWGHPEAYFGHVMDSYDASYYSYLYSQIFADDIFQTIFKSDPMNSRQGRRYRHEVLEKGASQDEMKTLTDFLDRKPNNEAFYKALGLT